VDKGFNILQKIVQATNVRQKVLASNIANADTPGYKGKDVKFHNLLGKEMHLLTTNAKHLGGAGSATAGGRTEIEDALSWEDLNNVELNVEVANMTENAMLHNAITNYRENYGCYR